MKNSYSKTPPPVKTHYTIRTDGRVWSIRATHKDRGMKKLAYKFYWLPLAVIGIALGRMGVPLIILMLAAFCVSLLVEAWHDHRFNQKLAQMAREVRERQNG